MYVSHIICPNCSVGCGLDIIVDDGCVVGTHPYKSHPINEGKNCNDGRKSFEIVNNENRLLNSYIKENGKLVESNLDDLIPKVASNLKSFSPDEIFILVSGNSNNKTIKLLKSIADDLEISNIGFYNGNFKNHDINNASYDDINKADFILTIGDVLLDHPLIGRRVYMAMDNGAEMVNVDTLNKTFSGLNSTNYFKVPSISSFLDDIPYDIESKLTDSSVVLVDKIDSDDDFEKIINLANNKKSKIIPVLENSNSNGALDLINPLNKEELEEKINDAKFVYLVGEDEIFYELESIASKDFLVSQNYNSSRITDISDVVIASACWAEEDGSFTNSEGTLQFYNKVLDPPENVSTNEEILTKLADELSIELK